MAEKEDERKGLAEKVTKALAYVPPQKLTDQECQDSAEAVYGNGLPYCIVDEWLKLDPGRDREKIRKDCGKSQTKVPLEFIFNLASRYGFVDSDPNAGSPSTDANYTANDNPRKQSDRLEITSYKDIANTEYPDLYWVVDGIIPEGLFLYIGASKAGKSWHMYNLSHCVASGHEFWNRTVTKSPVLYLALEDSPRRIQSRMEQMHLYDAPESLYITTQAPNMDRGLLDYLDEWLSDQEKPSLIIIDVFQKIKGRTERGENAYEADYRIASQLKRLADKHHSCVICVHHTNKIRNPEDIYERISGSNGLMACADTIAMLQRERGSNVATVNITGRDVEECEITLDFINGLWIAETDKTKAEREMDEYSREPVVRVMRKLISENPSGAFVPYDDFNSMSYDLTGKRYRDGREIGMSIKALANKLKQMDQISVLTGQVKTVNGNSSRGFNISKLDITRFQQKLL